MRERVVKCSRKLDPLGDCSATAASSRRACCGLNTVRLPMACTAFGGFHSGFSGLSGLPRANSSEHEEQAPRRDERPESHRGEGRRGH